jgi:hypothetical protein
VGALLRHRFISDGHTDGSGKGEFFSASARGDAGLHWGGFQTEKEDYAIPDRLLDAYPGRVRITSYVEDGHFIVEPTDPTITTAQLQAEFGFESTFQ